MLTVQDRQPSFRAHNLKPEEQKGGFKEAASQHTYPALFNPSTLHATPSTEMHSTRTLNAKPKTLRAEGGLQGGGVKVHIRDES